jgi:hypothetical protein
MKNLTNIIVLLGIGLLATGCAGSFRTSARAETWMQPPPPAVVFTPAPPPVVVAPPPVVVAPPPVVVAPLPPPINIEVTEVITVIVDDFDNVWDWTLRMFVRVRIGSHPERHPHRHTVPAHWDAGRGCYTYVGVDGQLHEYRR